MMFKLVTSIFKLWILCSGDADNPEDAELTHEYKSALNALTTQLKVKLPVLVMFLKYKNSIQDLLLETRERN